MSPLILLFSPLTSVVDGKNLKYLLSHAANTPLLAFLFLYHDRDLVQKATSPGLPPHTVVRTLVLWIIWLLTSPRECTVGFEGRELTLGVEGMEKEEMEDIEEFLFCLRPYVFAARQVSHSLSFPIPLPTPSSSR